MNDLMWHFARVGSDGTPRLGYGDNREIRVGETLRVEIEPILCEQGLHASARLWDALSYARGERLSLCLVTLGGTVLHDANKSVANERTVVAMLDAGTTDKLLRDYARWCALQVIHLWDAPDVVRQYLETGDDSLRSWAWAAAWATARTAAWTWARATSASADATWAAATAIDAAAATSAATSADAGQYAAELERRGLEAMRAAT